MSLSTVNLSDVDRDLLKKIVLLLDAINRGGSVEPFSKVDSKVVTTS